MNPLTLIAWLRGHRKVLTLLAVLVVGAGFYVQWQTAEIGRQRAAADRASLIGAADATCAALGSQFRPVGVKREQWGMACLAEAGRLGRIEGDMAQGSLDVAIDAMERRNGKESTDAALAAQMSKRTAEAVQHMEAADAAVQNDRVGAGWAAAVNELGGLQRR